METLGRLLAAADGGRETVTPAWDVVQRLLAAGLVEVVDPAAPRSEWALRIPPLLWDLVQGRDVRAHHRCDGHGDTDHSPV